MLLAGQGRRDHSDATELRDDPALRLATRAAKEGIEVLREGLQRLAGWRLKAMGGWRRPKKLVIDIDSLPVEVHGEQPGSAWNGYYRRRVYHPIVAAAGETGDILDLRLREGQVHTADGGTAIDDTEGNALLWNLAVVAYQTLHTLREHFLSGSWRTAQPKRLRNWLLRLPAKLTTHARKEYLQFLRDEPVRSRLLIALRGLNRTIPPPLPA